MSRKWKKTKKLLPIKAKADLKNLPNRLDICGASSDFVLQAAEGDGDKKLRKFSITAYTGVSMRIGGFASPVVVELTGLKVQSDQRPILFNHDTERIVGHSTEIEVTDQRLKLSGVISGVGDDADKVTQMADNGFPWQASLGASTEQIEFVDKGNSVKVNGRNFNGPLYVARKTTLREVSFVPIGADGATSAKIAAHSTQETDMDFDKWLEANEFDADTLTEKQRAKLEAAWKAENAPAKTTKPAKKEKEEPEKKVEAGDSLDDIVAAARKENERRAEITEIIAKTVQDHPDLLDHIEAIGRQAINGKWDRQRFELELLRIVRTPGPLGLIVRGSETEVSGPVIEAAVCMTGNLANIEKCFEPKVLDAAHRKYRSGLGLSELIAMFAKRRGWNGHSVKSDMRGALRAAFDDDDRYNIRANVGPSTYDLGGILSNVANKFLRSGFEAVESTWREIAAIGSVRDFKERSSYSLTGDLTYVRVAPGGEIKHGSIDAEEYTNQAKTYGKMFGIDRRDLINDDLGALTNVGRRLGRGGALALNKEFWTEFMDNGSFFTSARGNFDDGTDSEFDADGLESANLLFLNQTDPDGQPLSVQPRILLVPPSKLIAARRLINSEQLLTANEAGSTNPWANAFRIVSSTYLSNSSITGNSTKKWYLLADPNDLPVIEVVFLNGVQTPTVEQSDLDFDRLGIAFRGYHDFGVAKQEYRAGVAMKGEV